MKIEGLRERSYMTKQYRAALGTGPPDDDVPCKGWANFFDMDFFGEGFHGGYSDWQERELRQMSKTALEVCASCPLINRKWCLRQVNPRQTGFTGVAAATVFWHGRPIGQIDAILDAA